MSKLSLASKFGVELKEAKELLPRTRQVADALGICFHVGSQAMSPSAYVQAMEKVRAAIIRFTSPASETQCSFIKETAWTVAVPPDGAAAGIGAALGVAGTVIAGARVAANMTGTSSSRIAVT